MILVLLVGVGLFIWIMRKRARQNVLAGRVAERPTYHAEPPSRRVSDRRGEAL